MFGKRSFYIFMVAGMESDGRCVMEQTCLNLFGPILSGLSCSWYVVSLWPQCSDPLN